MGSDGEAGKARKELPDTEQRGPGERDTREGGDGELLKAPQRGVAARLAVKPGRAGEPEETTARS